MTVIAWDGRTLAADKQVSASGIVYKADKLYKFSINEDGVMTEYLAAGIGYLDASSELLEWCKRGFKYHDFPATLGTVASQSYAGSLFVVNKHGYWRHFHNSPCVPEQNGRYAAGSGAMAAMAILEDGGSATKAVEIACKVCEGCGMGVDSLEFKPITVNTNHISQLTPLFRLEKENNFWEWRIKI